MIDRKIAQCNYCKTKIGLRFQMGYFDIPFDFRCPECGVRIHGIRKITADDSLNLNNARIINTDAENMNYYADFSVELPHVKITKYESLDKILENGFSPFMLAIQLYGDEYQNKLIPRIRSFLWFRDNTWKRLLPLFDLYFNNKIELTEEHFLQLSPRFVVKHKLDALMALHQSTVLGLGSILEDDALTRFMDITSKIMMPGMFLKIDDLVSALGGEPYFTSISKRIINIYSRWIDSFEKYIPAVMLSMGGASEKFDKNVFGIATTNFEDMKSFYADSYELILDFVDIAIGLNNIAVRGDYNSFCTIVDNSKNQVVSFVEYQKKVKSAHLEYLVDNEPFSKTIPLKRNVRNAIAHFNYEFDASSQKIVFRDKHKDKENTVELFLIDLALLCYDNMMILAYLDELSYTLQKVRYTKNGMHPNIKLPK